MIIKNGQKYDNCFARAAAYFIGTCAERSNDNVNRQAAYDYIVSMYDAIAQYPEQLGYKSCEDTFFSAWEKQNGRQGDIKIIRGAIDKIEKLIGEFFGIVVNATPCEQGFILNDSSKPKRALTRLLDILGTKIENNTLILQKECVNGLCKLAEISQNNVIHITDSPIEDKSYFLFSHCVFNPEDNWVAHAFDKMLCANGYLVWLCNELEKRGYRRVDCKDGKRVSIDYVKLCGKKDAPIKASWADKLHSGIEVTFEDLRIEPVFLWLRMPMYKTILENIHKLPTDVADFLLAWTKNCDGCRYCVQTDKTGTRPLASIPFGDKLKCPLYPSFSMNWRELDEELAKMIVASLDAIDALILA